MQLNKLFFPSSKPTYTKVSISLLRNVELLQIPSAIGYFNCRPYSREVPVLLVKHQDQAQKYIMFFHSNSEDIYNCYEYLYPIVLAYRINLILVEYPSYGIYGNCSASATTISEDAIAVFEYFINKRRIRQEDIIVMGRSMGTGPACLLASKYQPAGLITISAYTSLKDVAQSFIGSVLSKLIEERFDNLKIIPQVKCPMLVIHGLQDNFINCDHSKKLISSAKSKIKQYHFSETMVFYLLIKTHNNFCIHDDIIMPLKSFFEKIDFPQPTQPLQCNKIVLRQNNSKRPSNLIQ